MAKISVFGRDGRASGEVEVAEEVLVLERGDQAVRDVVVGNGTSQRAGTASTLSKGEVAGSNKKPWRQKGTGRARAGLRQSPVWRGGGVAFGPKPRDFSVKLNKKVSKLAFRRALSERICSGDLKIVEDLSFSEPGTKEFVSVLKALGTPSCLVVTLAVDPVLKLSSRNVKGVEVVRARDCSVYQVLRYPALVVTRPAWEALKVRLEGGALEETMA